MAAYCQLLDDGRFEEFADLWTLDATAQVRDDVFEGRDAIREWMEQVQPVEARGRHVVINTWFQSESADQVTCVSDFVFLARRDGGWAPSVSGRYLDTWANDDGRWRLADRRIEM